MKSISIVLQPNRTRNRGTGYFAWVIRSGQEIPTPADMKDFRLLSHFRSPQGDEELLEGDAVIVSEKDHKWGWSSSAMYARNGRVVRPAKFSHFKRCAKLAGLDPELLKGAGELAACVRFIHAMRSGFGAVLIENGAAYETEEDQV